MATARKKKIKWDQYLYKQFLYSFSPEINPKVNFTDKGTPCISPISADRNAPRRRKERGEREREHIMAGRRERFEVKTPMDSGIFVGAAARRSGGERKNS